METNRRVKYEGRGEVPFALRHTDLGLCTGDRNTQGSVLPWHSFLTSARYLSLPSCFCAFACPSMAMFTFLGNTSAGSGIESSSTPL